MYDGINRGRREPPHIMLEHQLFAIIEQKLAEWLGLLDGRVTVECVFDSEDRELFMRQPLEVFNDVANVLVVGL